MLDGPDFLRAVLLLDAASCVATGAVMAIATAALSSMSLIPGSIRLAVGRFALLFDGVIGPNGAGVAFVALQAIAVVLLAELEFMGLRRTPARAEVIVRQE